MKLNKNSFSSKFYRWFYETSILPKSLCPYFWKLLLAWALVALFWLPAIVLMLPILIIGVFNRDVLSMLVDNKYGALLMGVIIYLALFVLVCIVFFFLTLFGVMTYVEGSNIASLQLWGGVFSAFGLGGGVSYLIKYLSKIKSSKVKQPSILSEFIKAKYNKYCPKIDWE